MKVKTFTVRIAPDLLDKLHVVAEYEGRSANGQVLVLIRKCIEAYEREHGAICVGKTPGGAGAGTGE